MGLFLCLKSNSYLFSVKHPAPAYIAGMSTQIHTLQALGAKRYAFKAQGEEAATIDIFGEIDGWWGYGVREMAYNLASNKKKKLTINIHSPGGSVTEGFGIANLIAGHKAETTTVGIGFVASIASVILLAGDRVTMAENAWLMIHNPWGMMMGDSEDMRKTADLLDKMENQIAGVYAAKMQANGNPIELEDVKALMAEETWYTAEEAKAVGLIDEVVNAVEPDGTSYEEKEEYGMEEMLNKFKNVPQALAAQFHNTKNTKMAKDKSLFAKIGELFVAAAEEINEDAAQTETPPPATEDATTDATMTAEEMIEYLKREGYTVAQQEEKTPETQSEKPEAAEAESELVLAMKAQIEELTKAVKRKVGTPSGGAASTGEQAKAGSAPKAAMPFFDNLANAIKAHRPG